MSASPATAALDAAAAKRISGPFGCRADAQVEIERLRHEDRVGEIRGHTVRIEGMELRVFYVVSTEAVR